MSYYIGIDFGTSGARAIAISSDREISAIATFPFTATGDLASLWQQALGSLLEQLPTAIRGQLRRVAINGTSGTVLFCDGNGHPVVEPLLYNDKQGAAAIAELEAIAPPEHVVRSASSSLAKLIRWQQQSVEGAYFLHQADWLGFLLHGQLGISDYHNALKLGYDVENLCYPPWLEKLPTFASLPRVLPPGTPVGEVKPEIAKRFDLPRHCQVCTGTTDSIAAFLASGANTPGEAVTSLGSTLVLKLLGDRPIEEASSGIYSHRLGDLWLTGGASNTGGAVLRHFFSDEELVAVSQQIEPQQVSPLDYYPLLEPGDRFPINDPNLAPRLEPRPGDKREFLHGLLESMARIEARGYRRLQELGATTLSRVYTAGGGAKNSTWSQIRQRLLEVPVIPAPHTEAAYGTALLAMGHQS